MSQVVVLTTNDALRHAQSDEMGINLGINSVSF